MHSIRMMLGRLFKQSSYWILICIACTSCEKSEVGRSDFGEVLRISVLPDQDIEQIRQSYTPLVEYLSDELGVNTELIPVESYPELVAKFGAGDIDLALFGGVTFVQAYNLYNARPIVTRSLDRRFTSYILVSSNHQAEHLADLHGARFGFGSRQSTSGHFMPRYFLQEAGIIPEQSFSEVVYTGAHDATARMVQEGRIDAGVVNSSLIDQLYQSKQLDPNRVRILWKSPPYVDYVWALRADFNSVVINKIQDAFFSLSNQNDQQTNILRALNADYYLPVAVEDYRELFQIVESIDSEGNF